jgi:hypothetical protein
VRFPADGYCEQRADMHLLQLCGVWKGPGPVRIVDGEQPRQLCQTKTIGLHAVNLAAGSIQRMLSPGPISLVDQQALGAPLKYKCLIDAERAAEFAVETIEATIEAHAARVHKFAKRPVKNRLEFEPCAEYPALPFKLFACAFQPFLFMHELGDVRAGTDKPKHFSRIHLRHYARAKHTAAKKVVYKLHIALMTHTISKILAYAPCGSRRKNGFNL